MQYHLLKWEIGEAVRDMKRVKWTGDKNSDLDMGMA